MANKPKSDRESEILKEARKRINDALSADQHNRYAALDDLRMKVGEDHWRDGDTDFEKQRKADGRPCLVFNRLPGFVSQVIGDLRANRPSCKCHPADNRATVDIADLLEGRIRNIEAESNAESVYDTGAQQAAESSFGAWRVITEYGDNESFNQIARIQSIENQFGVIWDHMSLKWDKSDAEWVAVLTKVHKDVYKTKYKGKTPKSFEVSTGGTNWYVKDTYTLCEYFRREDDKSKTLYMLPPDNKDISLELLATWTQIKVENGYEDGQVIEELPEQLKEIWSELMKEGGAKQRKVQERKIARYLLSGHEILENRQEWASDKYWPIVPVSGKETNIDGKIYKASVIRYSKDAQKAYNFGWNTALEEVAIVPKSPYLVTPEQIKGFEGQWQLAHKKTYPYLPYNRDPKNPAEGAPQRTQPAQASTAITEITMRAVDDMRATANVFDPATQQISPDTSGKAVLARVSRSGIANYEFIDNVSRSMALTWKILLDILPKIEDTAREVRIRKPDNTVKTEKINWPNDRQEIIKGAPPIKNDLSVGRYDVTVTVGPSYATQRMEAAENTLKLMQVLPPQIGIILADFVVRNFDWHGAQEAAERIKLKMVKMGEGYLYKPEEVQKLMQQISTAPPLPPNPMVAAKMKQEQFKAMKAMMEVIKKQQEMGQLKEEHIWKLIQNVNEAGMKVMQQEQQRLMQPPGGGAPMGAEGAPSGMQMG